MHTMDIELSPLQTVLLDVLKNNGDWMTRKQLGESIDRSTGKLQYYDVMQLERLIDLNLVESREVLMGAVMKGFQYRAIEASN